MNKVPSLVLLLLFIIIIGCSNEGPDLISGFQEILPSPMSSLQSSKTSIKKIKFKLEQGVGFIVIKVKKQKFYIDTKEFDYILGEQGFNIIALDGTFEIEVNLLNNRKKKSKTVKINDKYKMDFQINVSRREVLDIRVDFYEGRKSSLKRVLKILRGIKYT